MGTHRTFANLQQSYFLGATARDRRARPRLEAAGIQDLVLATCDYDLEHSNGSPARSSPSSILLEPHSSSGADHG